MLKQAVGELSVRTGGPGFTEITAEVQRWLDGTALRTGLLTVFLRHTSASLLIQENADPDVLRDLQAFLERIAPWGGVYRHDREGPDDMPAHIRAALTQTSLAIPVSGGRMMLGAWQGLYVIEHRARPYARTLALHVTGE